MKRLSEATLAALPRGVARPGYDRSAVRAGVVHLGIGAFHRAHQAVVFERALEAGDLRWGITGVSLRSRDVSEAMTPQDGLYTVTVRDGAAARVACIGAVRRVLVAPRAPAAVIAALAAPETHLVTLTITEKGYHLDAANGSLRLDDPAVAADLAAPAAPATAVGFLVAGLAARRRAGLAPFTMLSCDNLPANGARLRGAVLAMADATDSELAAWIEREGAFPSTMVDRIVPASTDGDMAAAAAAIGIEDRAAVRTEPFLQWVIEDRFCGARPDLDRLGAQLTTDVGPWEAAKLRLLNGAHSAIAYVGGLADAGFVHQAVAMPPIRRFVEALWAESASTLSPPPELDLQAYRTALMARFDNAALAHRLGQIAQDGSQKLPQRLVAPMLERHRAGHASPALALAIAAWMRWVERRLEPGDDPLSDVIVARLNGIGGADQRVAALLSIAAIFPAELAGAETLRDSIARGYRLLGDADLSSVLRRVTS